MVKRRAAVIGSGFGGLSAAIRLQSAGFETEIFEKRDLPGGRAYVFRDEGFTFDAGPTVITAPHCLEELFELSGRNLRDSVELLPVEPFYRLCWENGYTFDYGSSLDQTLSQISKKSQKDALGYQKFLQYSEQVFEEGYRKLVHVPFLTIWSMVRVAPQLIKLQAFRSVYSMVSRFIRDEQLRQAFSFHSLLVGGNPFTASSIYTLIHYLERNWGVFFPTGGTGALVQALVRLFEQLGGQIHYQAEVSEIVTSNGNVVGIRSRGQKVHPFDVVVSNADVVHTYEHLLKENPSVEKLRKKLRHKKQSMSLFLIYFGTKKKYPKMAHHTVIFGPRYRELLNDIFSEKILADDFSLYLHTPTVTDPSLAPEGCEAFYVLSPVPHLESGSINWEEKGPKYAEEILKYLEERFLPGLRDEIVTKRIFTPLDFKSQLNAHWGSAFSFEPTLSQSAYFRAHNRDPRLRGLYFVGAGTHPGAGLPGVVNSAKATVSLIEKDYQVSKKGIALQSKAIIGTGSKTFSFAAKIFSGSNFLAASLIYAWCRYCDDRVDECGTSVDQLRNDIAAIYENKEVEHPAFAGFKRVASEYSIPMRYPMDLLLGLEMDSKGWNFKTLDELELYCYRVAGTVGLMMAHVMGVTDYRALQQACDLGIAMQMTNIARDVIEDAAKGRVYIPDSWISEVSLNKDQILDRKNRAQVFQLAERLIKEADRYYASGNNGLNYLQLRSALAVSVASSFYQNIGRRILKLEEKSWDQRVFVPWHVKIGLLFPALFRVLRSHSRHLLKPRSCVELKEVWRFKYE